MAVTIKVPASIVKESEAGSRCWRSAALRAWPERTASSSHERSSLIRLALLLVSQRAVGGAPARAVLRRRRDPLRATASAPITAAATAAREPAPTSASPR
eukprot:CAMPEP_0171257602 /NCGR_PEP_ID=MMETSP0790-20130122/53932_1 /TAXON_ID=2925 /ORGANISM="Alexandrium catenella, Strain OF101" /LENGTH=99 /DNA_ID=CAMNT_0011725721 /DNA_START=126 /DNA_END=425 /DNA_ORIENTATION=-